MKALRRRATRRIMRTEARIIHALEKGPPRVPLIHEPWDYTTTRAGQAPPDPVGCLPHLLLVFVLVAVLVVAVIV